MTGTEFTAIFCNCTEDIKNVIKQAVALLCFLLPFSDVKC